MGPVVDRSKEQLGAADVVIVRVRQQLLEAIRSYMESGKVPWRDGIDYSRIRALATSMPVDTDWREMDTISFDPPPQPVAAE